MVVSNGNHPIVVVPHMKGGEGEMIQEHLVSQEDLGKAGRLFARGILKPGHSVGMHFHDIDMEICYFLSGTGVVIENDTEIPVGPGDVNLVRPGEGHEIRNTSASEDLVYMAVVLYPNGIA